VRESTFCGLTFSQQYWGRQYFSGYEALLPFPATARSKEWLCGRSLDGIAGLNPAGGQDVCLSVVIVVVLSGRCLCVGLNTRPESYRVWCV